MSLDWYETSTRVTIDGENTVEIETGQPWPGAYCGSKYSLVSIDDFHRPAIKWEHRDLQIFTKRPDNLWKEFALLGKDGGLGSFRVTATGEVLTKIPYEEYKHADQAPPGVDDGWVPVYVGKLTGSFDFDGIDLDPISPQNESIAVWKGLPFSHGERWSVTTDGRLEWRWKDFAFPSASSHSELVETYRTYRPNGGRIYITEHGHVWGNVDSSELSGREATRVSRAVSKWKSDAEEAGQTATLRLVNRRMTATSSTDSPKDGLLPIHLGSVSQFDDGAIPQAVVTEPEYYTVVGQYETVWE